MGIGRFVYLEVDWIMIKNRASQGKFAVTEFEDSRILVSIDTSYFNADSITVGSSQIFHMTPEEFETLREVLNNLADKMKESEEKV